MTERENCPPNAARCGDGIGTGVPEGDRPAAVTLGPVERLGKGFRAYERHHFHAEGPDGTPRLYDRDVLRAGAVVGLLPIDLARREVVLIRQFRLAAHLATGRGELVELVAGRVDAGETPTACALRECREEIGLTPTRITPLMTLLVAPAFSDEIMTLFVAEVDARDLPDLAGKADEGEVIRPFRVSIDAALDMLDRGVLTLAPLIVALQWLALNQARLGAVFANAPTGTDARP